MSQRAAAFLFLKVSLRSEVLRSYSYPFSLDVKDMYTSIPSKEAIDLLYHKLCQDNFCYQGLLPIDIKELLGVLFDNNFLRFGNLYYKQTSGLPMGNKLSALLAGVFMDRLEAPVVQQLNLPFYMRYVDDCILLTKDDLEATLAFDRFNNVHHDVKFEMEKPSNGRSLSLLDFTVSIVEGKATVQPFIKAVRSDVMFNGNTALPTRMKNSIVINE